MRHVPATLSAAIVAGLSACGAGPQGGTHALAVSIQGVSTAEVGSFQAAVLREGSRYDCAAVQARCLRDQVDDEALVPVLGPDGDWRPAVRFEAAPTPDAPSGTEVQDVEVQVAVGDDYALVVEALSRSEPPTFLGGVCTYLRNEVVEGPNAPVLTYLLELRPEPLSCDPRIDP